jgi:hypothetical protein
VERGEKLPKRPVDETEISRRLADKNAQVRFSHVRHPAGKATRLRDVEAESVLGVPQERLYAPGCFLPRKNASACIRLHLESEVTKHLLDVVLRQVPAASGP